MRTQRVAGMQLPGFKTGGDKIKWALGCFFGLTVMYWCIIGFGESEVYKSDVTQRRLGSMQVDKAGLESVRTEIDFSKTYDVCTVGAGLSGTIFAERFASLLGKQALVIDSRSHFGGNCYDYVDSDTGILMNKYGAHLFHTNSEKAWKYLNMHAQAPKWERWDHEVKGWVDGKLVPIPVNINTVNRLFDSSIKNEAEMLEWLSEVQIPCPVDGCQNAEQMAMSRVGPGLFESIFRKYTRKQWNKEARELDALVTARIPVRSTFDPRYFADRFQALPSKGYTAWFAAVLKHPNIDVVLKTDYFKHKEHLDKVCGRIIYTGPIDSYFAQSGLEKLEYRGIEFKIRKHFDINGYILPNSVVNYPGDDVKFTRIVEYKHFLHQHSPHSVTVSEFSKEMGPGDDPYYPVPSPRNQALYDKYKKMAKEIESTQNVHFVGRLANYKYFNMDATIVNALDMFYEVAGRPEMHDMPGLFGAGASKEEAGDGFISGNTKDDEEGISDSLN